MIETNVLDELQRGARHYLTCLDDAGWEIESCRLVLRRNQVDIYVYSEWMDEDRTFAAQLVNDFFDCNISEELEEWLRAIWIGKPGRYKFLIR